MAWETSTARVRRVRTLAGQNMCTPLEPLDLTRDGRRVETLWPGRTRVAIDHEWVREHPEKFRACMPGDRRTQDRLRGLLKDALRSTERAIGKGGAPAGNSRPWLGSTAPRKGRRWL